jgi:molecular chaperone DnaK (HSP70)
MKFRFHKSLENHMILLALFFVSSRSAATLGIDFGTENLRAVAYNGKAPRLVEIVENADGDAKLSTAVAFANGELMVGGDALHYSRKKPEKVRSTVR